LENAGLNVRQAKNQFISLLEKKKELQPQYEKLRLEIDKLNIQISSFEQALRAEGIDTYKIKQKVRPPKLPVEPVRKIDTIPDMIEKMLKAYKLPMHYTEIWKQLNMSGIHVGGKDRANTTLAYITRNPDRFQKAPEAGRGYYKIKEGKEEH
jgi:hypothetical protein